jgi:hypothetical protein
VCIGVSGHEPTQAFHGAASCATFVSTATCADEIEDAMKAHAARVQ